MVFREQTGLSKEVWRWEQEGVRPEVGKHFYRCATSQSQPTRSKVFQLNRSKGSQKATLWQAALLLSWVHKQPRATAAKGNACFHHSLGRQPLHVGEKLFLRGPFSSHLSVGLGHPRLCFREVVCHPSWCSSRTASSSPSTSFWWLPAQSSRFLSLQRVKLKIQLNTHSVLLNDVDDAGLWLPLCNCSHPFLLLKTRERSFFAFWSLIPGYLIRNLFSYCEMLLASQNGDFSWEFTEDWVNLGRSLEN